MNLDALLNVPEWVFLFLGKSFTDIPTLLSHSEQLRTSIYFIDIESNRLYLEKIDGMTVKQKLWDYAEGNGYMTMFGIADTVMLEWAVVDLEREECLGLARLIGESIARMHEADVVHGDLTTSNMLIRCTDGRIVLIDFGLGSMKPTAEDKAVDLYVLERAFASTHAGSAHLVSEF